MSPPWMKFYPADWRADTQVRLCSMAARGLWIELLCLMHEASPRGSLVMNGKPMSDAHISVLTGAKASEVPKLLRELEDNGVFSRDEDGTIFSRRMRADDLKAEQDKANGRRGGNPKLKPGPGGDNGGDNPPHNGRDKAQTPEARSQRLEGGGDASARLPEGWGPTEADLAFLKESGRTDGDIAADLEQFRLRAQEPGEPYRYPNSAFRAFCLSGKRPQPPPQSRPSTALTVVTGGQSHVPAAKPTVASLARSLVASR